MHPLQLTSLQEVLKKYNAAAPIDLHAGGKEEHRRPILVFTVRECVVSQGLKDKASCRGLRCNRRGCRFSQPLYGRE